MKTIMPLVFALYLMGNSAFATPCLDYGKIPALPFTGISVFADCDNDQILYFVPEDLNIKAGLFSREKRWHRCCQDVL